MDNNFLLNRPQGVIVNRKSLKTCLALRVYLRALSLEPVLFLVFIKDLPEVVDYQVALITDAALKYQTTECSHDTLNFQENLTVLSKWADKWGMDFNAKKSKILLFSSKSKLPHYSLLGHELKILEEVKYRGVVIQSDMKFTAHIYRKVITANQQLGMIKSAVVGCYQCQTACLQDSPPPSSRVYSCCLGSKQQERYIRHKTSRSSITIYLWYQGL